MKPAYFSIKHWERFQHYKDRDPPWVKLYRDLLTSESWVLGTDLSRVVQVASVMLAPRYGNKIPYRFDLLRKVMSLECKEGDFSKAIDHLVATDFFEVHEVTKQDEVAEQSASTPIATCTSETEQRRAEKSREYPPTPQGGVLAVFEHWQREWNHPDAKLDEKRRARIAARLKTFTPEQLCKAISGFKHSDWHTGRDPKGGGRVYDGLLTLLRDDEQVERGLQLFAHPPHVNGHAKESYADRESRKFLERMAERDKREAEEAANANH